MPQYDQYYVCVVGSGRATISNRLLMKFIPVIPRTPIMMALGYSPKIPTVRIEPTTPNVPPLKPNPQPDPPPQNDPPQTSTPNPQPPAIVPRHLHSCLFVRPKTCF
ncbi:hypothetical protein PoB_000338300 [Plakobranchus ocellatus]|uniref:Uncharacterized protein n=1 Tax=Plakobranchus ocellatus TaxID=259542 RepID=A0AAV3Y2P7_9GAST|nr:hypothetical protein PoB_000338300 [Plakobranchus ocellatus]